MNIMQLLLKTRVYPGEFCSVLMALFKCQLQFHLCCLRWKWVLASIVEAKMFHFYYW